MAGPRHWIIGEAGDGLEARRMVADLHPDVLLLDLVMPGLRSSETEKPCYPALSPDCRFTQSLTSCTNSSGR